jgi:hypothetical protein
MFASIIVLKKKKWLQRKKYFYKLSMAYRKALKKSKDMVTAYY